MEEGALVIAFLVVVGLLLLGVALFILLDDPDSSTAAAAAPAEPSSSSTASAAAASSSSGSSSSKQIRNEYRSGMRVERSSAGAPPTRCALPEFAADEPEELLANLPKIIEALLGLDTSQAATGWLNQQAELSNPMLNPKLAVELQASLFRLLSADGERSVVARLLAEYSADRSAPAVRQRPVYNFFTSQLTAAAVRSRSASPASCRRSSPTCCRRARCTTRGPSSRSPRRRAAAARRRRGAGGGAARRRAPAPPQDREAPSVGVFPLLLPQVAARRPR